MGESPLQRDASSNAGAGIQAEPVPSETVLKVRPDGPNVVTGDVALVGAKSNPKAARTTLVLCRCGASSNKPYCDGTHVRIGFREAGLLPADTPAGVRSVGSVTIAPMRNGPLECRGALVVEGADGRSTCSEEMRLCRCGQSRKKPFCDSSHARVGFTG